MFVSILNASCADSACFGVSVLFEVQPSKTESDPGIAVTTRRHAHHVIGRAHRRNACPGE